MKKQWRRKRASKKREELNSGPMLVRHPISNGDQSELRRAISAMAVQNADQFPKLLDRIKEILKKKDPLQALATLATYGLFADVSDRGVHKTSEILGIHQHHVELLQALIVAMPIEEWDNNFLHPSEIQDIIDTLKLLTDAFHQRRLKLAEKDHDPQEKTASILQERIRLHTQVVRNWGYFNDVVAISSELYGELDVGLNDTLGFTASDLIAVARKIVKLVNDNVNKWFRSVARIFREHKISRIVRRYYKEFPDIRGDPEEYIKIIPPGASPDSVKANLLSHAELKLKTLFIISDEDIAKMANLAPELVTKILRALSLKPGELADNSQEHFFLTNPIWIRPIIQTTSGYFCPVPGGIFSHINEIMRSLAETAKKGEALERRRAIYLEEKVRAILVRALPDAAQRHRTKWTWGGVEYENDHLVVLDNTAIIVEDKSAALTPAGLRGAIERLKRHVRDLVLSPSEQSGRLQNVIQMATAGHGPAIAALEPFDVDIRKIERVIRVSITLDDISILCSAEKELVNAGWIPYDSELATTMNVADLAIVVDVLDRPCYLIHYLAERQRFQKLMTILADEADFLGFYLETGMNRYDLEEQKVSLALLGMSSTIDQYYESRDAGVLLCRPKLKIGKYFRKLIECFEERRFPGWLGVGVDLLRSASFEEQNRLNAKLDWIRQNVRKNWRDPDHECCLVLTPPPNRETTIVFYVFPPELALQRRKTENKLAEKAFEISNKQRCIVIGRNTSHWGDPYAFISIVQRKEDTMHN